MLRFELGAHQKLCDVSVDKMRKICYTANINEDLEVAHGSYSGICGRRPPFHRDRFTGIIQKSKGGGHCSSDAKAGNEKERRRYFKHDPLVGRSDPIHAVISGRIAE